MLPVAPTDCSRSALLFERAAGSLTLPSAYLCCTSLLICYKGLCGACHMQSLWLQTLFTFAAAAFMGRLERISSFCRVAIQKLHARSPIHSTVVASAGVTSRHAIHTSPARLLQFKCAMQDVEWPKNRAVQHVPAARLAQQ
jgi:hypothetical protein